MGTQSPLNKRKLSGPKEFFFGNNNNNKINKKTKCAA